MTSAVLDDIASLALVAILVPVAAGQADINPLAIALIAGKAVLFFIIVSVIGIWIFPHNLTGWVARLPIVGRHGIKSLLRFGDGEYTTLAVLLIALVVGLLGRYFGFHPAIGAYMAGLIIKQEYFEFHRHPEVNYFEDTKKIIDNVAFHWIGPVFFVDLGAKIVFELDTVMAVIPQTLAMITCLFVAQVASAALASRYTGGMDWRNSVLVGFGMLGRAELAFVVMDIAYVQNPILTPEAFYTLMFTAFWLNVSVPVSIALWKRSAPEPVMP